MDQPVLVDKRDGLWLITLNRPEKLNAFNEAQHLALKAALDLAADDSACRTVLLTGAGRGFCAGQDLALRARPADAEAPDLGATLERFYNPLIRAMRAMGKPLVCAVNGVAAGAGANIALNCDIVLAAKSASFIQSFSRLGLVPDAGGTWVLPRLIGEARAKALVLTGLPVSADTAEQMGMIWKAVEDDQLMAVALELAGHLAQGPTYGLGLAKLALQAAHAHSLDAQLDLERDLQRKAGRTADYREGVCAFMEKRKPRFTGKA